ncbi:hypothetical protein [Azospirillum palustre]
MTMADGVTLMGVSVPLSRDQNRLFSALPVVTLPECREGTAYVVHDCLWDYRTKDHRAEIDSIDAIASSGFLASDFAALTIAPGDLVIIATAGFWPSTLHCLQMEGLVLPKQFVAVGAAIAAAVMPVDDWMKWRVMVAEKLLDLLDQAIAFDRIGEAEEWLGLLRGTEGTPRDMIALRELILLRLSGAVDRFRRRLSINATLLRTSQERLETDARRTYDLIREKYVTGVWGRPAYRELSLYPKATFIGASGGDEKVIPFLKGAV